MGYLKFIQITMLKLSKNSDNQLATALSKYKTDYYKAYSEFSSSEIPKRPRAILKPTFVKKGPSLRPISGFSRPNVKAMVKTVCANALYSAECQRRQNNCKNGDATLMRNSKFQNYAHN